jgi:L-lactate dehydrogenase complex protein LldG
MADDRESILSRVRGALAPLHERAALPQYDSELAVLRKLIAGRDLVELFAERIKRVNGLALTSATALVEHLTKNKAMRGYCDPVLWPKLQSAFGAEFKVETSFDRKRVDDYTFGITRAAGAIAESGTIVLADTTTSSRLGALAPWIHVAVIDRATLLPDIPAAITTFGSEPNIIWVTGPSKTADVEGILIEGVHGPGQQIGLVL